MHIAYLNDHPEFIHQVADWSFQEWGDETPARNNSEVWRRKFLQHLNTKNLPITLCAVDGKQCIGTVSLTFHDLDTHPHLSPWISHLYVIPTQRGKGVGTYLIKTIMRKAKELGCTKLYSYQTEILARNFKKKYNDIGLAIVETVKKGKETVVIVEIDLQTSQKETGKKKIGSI